MDAHNWQRGGRVGIKGKGSPYPIAEHRVDSGSWQSACR